MNKYITKEPITALLWCNNVGEMMTFIATIEKNVRVDMNVKEHGYGVGNLTLITSKGELVVRESVDYVVRGVDGDVYVIDKTIFDANFKLDSPELYATMSAEEKKIRFETQSHKM